MIMKYVSSVKYIVQLWKTGIDRHFNYNYSVYRSLVMAKWYFCLVICLSIYLSLWLYNFTLKFISDRTFTMKMFSWHYWFRGLSFQCSHTVNSKLVLQPFWSLQSQLMFLWRLYVILNNTGMIVGFILLFISHKLTTLNV